MTIGIITAMQKEQAQIENLLKEKHTAQGLFHYVTGALGEHNVVLQQCGIGKVNAAVGTTELIHLHHPDCIISTGVAGGADSCLRVMDVVVADRCVHHDFNLTFGYERGHIQGMERFFPSDSALLQKAEELHNPAIHTGLICTGDQFITAPADLQAIKSFFPSALAVDMESAAIAQTCTIYKIPFISFRIISDTPGAEAHHEQYNDFWAEMAQRSFQTTASFLHAL